MRDGAAVCQAVSAAVDRQSIADNATPLSAAQRDRIVST
jgi:hypothetical protein